MAAGLPRAAIAYRRFYAAKAVIDALAWPEMLRPRHSNGVGLGLNAASGFAQLQKQLMMLRNRLMQARPHNVASTPDTACRNNSQNSQILGAFPVTAARAWNALPSSVRSAPSLLQFRRDLKTALFQSSYSSP